MKRSSHPLFKRLAGRVSINLLLSCLFFMFSSLAFAQEAAPAAEANPKPAAEAAPASDDDCLACHGDSDIEAVTERGKKLKLHVAEDALKGSVHEGLGCTDCHLMGEQAETHGDEGFKGKMTFGCQACHEDVYKDYAEKGVHGREYLKGNPKAPSCANCHGGHQIKSISDPESLVSDQNQPETCGKCHGGAGVMDEPGIGKQNLIGRYKDSVHWHGIKEGKAAASCADCHGVHDILPSSDSKSQVTRVGLLTTCAKCHPAAVNAYSQGSHGKTLLHGNHEVPTCTTCHSDHNVMSLKTRSDGSRDYAATQVCIWCHDNERMMGRYNLDTSQVESFKKDIHGLVLKGSKGTAATCADCHDPHMALPSSDKRALMHPDNQQQTCSKCHISASKSFASSFSHKTRTQTGTIGGKVHQWVVIAYTLIILATIGGMLLHNFIIWSFFFRRKLRHVAKNAVIMRLTKAERAWHLLLLSSFITLVITGFGLSFPESWLYFWWPAIGIDEHLRSTIHHIAGLLNGGSMLIVVLWAAKRSGRQKWWFGMFPVPRDLFDFLKTMKYYLMLSDEKPKFAVFNYAEKFEYWALWWGTFVMVGTGLIMWFSPYMPANWPSWVFDMVRTIHFYEATLAALAIAIWHFFHVIYHPEEYPISTVMVSGVMDEHEATSRFDDEAIAKQAISPEDQKKA